MQPPRFLSNLPMPPAPGACGCPDTPQPGSAPALALKPSASRVPPDTGRDAPRARGAGR